MSPSTLVNSAQNQGLALESPRWSSRGQQCLLSLVQVVAAFAMLASGPASAQRRPGEQVVGVPATKNIVWPAPPDQPRVAFAATLKSDLDLRKDGGALSGLKRLVGGQQTAGYPVLRPHDMVVDSHGKVYVTCGIPTVVRVFDPNTRSSNSLGSSGTYRLVKPMGLAVDGGDNVYVADQGAKRVLVFGPTGEFVRLYGEDGMFVNPVAVALDQQAGLLYVVDAFLHQVLVLNRADGKLVRRIGRNVASESKRHELSDAPLTATHGAGAHDPEQGGAAKKGNKETPARDLAENRGTAAGEFRYPAFAAVAPNGTLYVTDGLNARVQAFDRSGKFLREVGKRGDGAGSFSRPKGVAVDAEGHLFVVDAAFSNVQIFDDQGRILMAFSAGGQGPGDLLMPSGIAIDRNDHIYVADRMNDRLQVFTFLRTAAGAARPDSGK